MSIYSEAKIEDKTNIAALIIQVWLHTYATEGIRDAISRYLLSELTEDNLDLDLTLKTKQYFVCEINNHIVGVAALDKSATCPVTGERLPELAKLYVQEHFTRQGIGSGLLAKALADCRNANHSKLWLSVNAKNTRAIEFYLAHGFLNVGTTNFELENEHHENYVLHKAIL